MPPPDRPLKIAIINPNSNTSMTTGLHGPIESLDYNNTEYTYYTAPLPSPHSINNSTDASSSAATFLAHHNNPSQLPADSIFASEVDAILVACFSPHPLVPQLMARKYRNAGSGKAVRVPVTGIFEASVQVAVGLLYRPSGDEAVSALRDEKLVVGKGEVEGEGERFGIVTTGDAWGPILREAVVHDLLGTDKAEQVFVGVECCGLHASELHEEGEGGGGVERRVKDAVRRLIENGGNVGVIILGCAGMAGMEEWVREVAPENVRVVDGVKAGVGMLQGLVRGGF